MTDRRGAYPQATIPLVKPFCRIIGVGVAKEGYGDGYANGTALLDRKVRGARGGLFPSRIADPDFQPIRALREVLQTDAASDGDYRIPRLDIGGGV